MNAIDKYLLNMNKPKTIKSASYRGFKSKEEYYANTSERQRMFNPNMLERLDTEARKFIMRPKFNTPTIKFLKLGWWSPTELTEKQKRLSTTGYIEGVTELVDVKALSL